MNMIFRYRTGWRVFLIICCIVLLVIAVLPFAFIEDDTSTGILWLFGIIALALTALSFYGLADIFMGYIQIDAKNVVERSPFSTKALEISDIKGFGEDAYYIHLYSKTSKNKVKISLYVSDIEKIRSWIYEAFPELGEGDQVAETEEIISNPDFGSDTASREELFKRAKSITSWFDFGSIGLFLYAVTYAKPYTETMIVVALLPLAALVVLWRFNGLVKINRRENSVYPSMAVAFIMAAVIGYRFFIDYDLAEYEPLLLGSIAPAIGIVFLAFYLSKELELKKVMGWVSIFLMSLFVYPWCYGTAGFINCRFDDSKPTVYNVKVLEKRIVEGNSKEYKLQLDAWGPRKEPEEVAVSQTDYENIALGETVAVDVFDGSLGVKWFEVEINSPQHPAK